MAPVTVRAELDDVLSVIQTGDIISSSHRSAFGRIIHIGQMFRRPWHSMVALVEAGEVYVVESTAAEAGGKGVRGVQRHRLVDRWAQTNGEVWVSRLSQDFRRLYDAQRSAEWMLSRLGAGARYSYGQAIWAGLDGLIRIIPENTWSSSYMCSRFAMAALRHGFADSELATHYIAREASPTPAQLVRMRGFFWRHYQVKGKKLHDIGGRG